MFCEKCGAKYDVAKFCSKCGNPIADKYQLMAEEEHKKKVELEEKQAQNRIELNRLIQEDIKINLNTLRNKNSIMKISISKIGHEDDYHDYSDATDISIGDRLTFRRDCQSNSNSKYRDPDPIVVDCYDYDIGEISTGTVEKIEAAGYDIDDVYGIVIEADSNSEPQKIKAAIYPNSLPDEYRYLHSYVAGVKYDNADGTSRQGYISNLKEKDLLSITASKFNGDPAVEVYTEDNKMIGYIPKDIAAEMCNKINSGKINNVVIEKILEQDGMKNVDIIISIFN